MHDYEWLDLGNGRKVYRKVDDRERQRSSLPAPMLISDHLDDVWHPHNGREYSSKSEFRAVTKHAGGEEVGNSAQTDNRSSAAVTKSEVGEALRKVRAGYKPKVTQTAGEGWC